MNKFFHGKFLEAIKLFNSEDFYGQHDILEYLWLNLLKSDPRRLVYQGILNIGVGFYHYTLRNSQDNKNHIRGCKKQLNKGMIRLKQFYEIAKNDKYQFLSGTIDFEWLKFFIEEVEIWQKWLLNKPDFEKHPVYPKINIDTKIKYV